jgi:hypothetical protein
MGHVMVLKPAAGSKPKMKRKAYEQELRKLQVKLSVKTTSAACPSPQPAIGRIVRSVSFGAVMIS